MMQHIKFEVWPPGHPETDLVRRGFAARMLRHYTGWCDNYDRQFDSHSFMFVRYAPDSGEYLATCRVVFKRLAGQIIATPSEIADLDCYSLPITSPTCCEGSMVGFATPHDMRTLMYGVITWLIANGVDEIFTTYDAANILTKRVFTRMLGFHPVSGAVVRYRSFIVTSTGEPASWQVIRANPLVDGMNVLQRLVAAGVAPYELPSECPKLADWI